MQDPRVTQQIIDETPCVETPKGISEDDIEVRYTPNRAQRRARAREAKRSVRRGTRAQDRKIAAMKAQMTPEEIERAERLADKQVQINMLRGRRG